MSSLRDSYGRVTDSELGIILRSMSDDGIFGGNPDANVNGSITPVDFWAQPLPTTEMIISQLSIEISDGGNPAITDYGSIVGPLVNGIQLFTEIDSVKTDFGNPLHSNREIAVLFPIIEIVPYSGSIDLRLYSFDILTHSKSPIRLNGNTNDKFGITIQDDLTALVAHSFTVKGNLRAINV